MPSSLSGKYNSGVTRCTAASVPGAVGARARDRAARLHGGVDVRRDGSRLERDPGSGQAVGLVVVELRCQAAGVAASAGELHLVSAGLHAEQLVVTVRLGLGQV